jgi:hypothetical protein
MRERLRISEFVCELGSALAICFFRVIRHSDRDVAKKIQRLKHDSMLRKADELVEQGQKGEAKLEYVALLKEEELDDQLRIHVSKKLAELNM